MGIPGLSGFYSKELIIELANHNNFIYYGFVISLISALLTSMYSIKLLLIGVLKEFKGSLLSVSLIKESETMIIKCLLSLCFLSLTVGFFSYHFFLLEEVPMINTDTKKLPLYFSLIGSFLSLLIYSLNIIGVYSINSFLRNNWNFEIIVNNSISKLLINLSGFFYFKVERGVLEKLGPNQINRFIKNYN
jgi:NADH:ubiquinone oxidoreductase subunit 5 (subunit L)/multisubunit Na+/H+ antiporter MnhA subunit